MNKSNLIYGTFLLLLTVSGSFIEETIGCKTQYFLRTNRFAKHILTIFLLYFCIEFADDEDKTHPATNLIHALKIWVLFIMFTKLTVPFTIIVFCLLTIILICKHYISYYTAIDTTEHLSKISTIENISSTLVNTTIGTLIIGVLLYLRKQYKDHKSTFSTIKFIFGDNTCDSQRKHI